MSGEISLWGLLLLRRYPFEIATHSGVYVWLDDGWLILSSQGWGLKFVRFQAVSREEGGLYQISCCRRVILCAIATLVL
jgi:hypothetical protein